METKMKKNIVLISLFFLVFNIFGEEYSLKKIGEFEQNKENGLFLRKYEEWAPYEDDLSAEYLIIDEKGNKYIYQVDFSRMMLLDRNNNIKKVRNLNKGKFSYRITNKHETFYFDGYYGYLEAFDFDGKLNFKISVSNILGSSQLSDYLFYYDEETDILFLQDKNDQLYSIINPSLDEEQNKKNFKTPEETLENIKNGTYGSSLNLTEYNELLVNGVRHNFKGERINNHDYRVVDGTRVFINYPDHVKKIPCSDTNNTEQIESIAIHPSGDIYVLRMNWTTNTHNLYRIENTWDPQWRKEWYENHETENVSQNILSTNLTVNKEMTCSDNLRLRSEEATSSRVITTMQKGTKVKILKLGKSETIDGISSNWVQVEVLVGGKEIKVGTVGWCYGGYLE